MKKRINYFISTYFYFNNQERKGVISLMFLLVLFQCGNFAFPIIYQRFIRSEPKPEMVQWALSASEDSYKRTLYGGYSKVKPNMNKYSISTRSSDSAVVYKKRKIQYPVNLNLVDSETLVYLPKIGPVLAGRIIQYRLKLRGFHSLNQLLEIWGFKEDFLYDLEGKIFVNSNLVQPYNLNQVNFDELKLHPYFKYTLSKAIINYRMQHGNYRSIDDLKNVKIVNDSIINVIKPYLKIE